MTTDINITKSFSAFTGELHSENTNLEIGLFIGNDITSLIAANKLVPQIIKAGYTPTLYLPEHRFSKKPEVAQVQLQDLSFYERYLPRMIEDLVKDKDISYQADGKPHTDALYTLDQLGEVHGINVETVPNVNDPDFVKSIADNPNMIGGVSIRCYQIWRTQLIEAFTNKKFKANPDADNDIQGFAWNAHPGKLPEFRGLFTPLQAIASLEKTFGWTLHEIIYDADDKNKGIDAGPIIHVSKKPIDFDWDAINLYTAFGPAVADMIFSKVEEKMDNGVVRTTSQEQHRIAQNAKYYSHPSKEFFENDWNNIPERRGQPGASIPQIVDWERMLSWYPNRFIPSNDTSSYAWLEKAIQDEIKNWENNKERFVAWHAHNNANAKQTGVVDYMIAQGKRFTDELPCAPQHSPTPQ